MRRWVFLLIALLAFGMLAFAESYRGTTADMYMESYMAAMRRQTGASAAEIRAEQYRSMYEICDEHHNCTNVTAGANLSGRPAEKARSQQVQTETVKPFIHAPVWF